MLVALYGSNGPSTGYTAPNEMLDASTAASPGDSASAMLAYQPVFAGETGPRSATIAQARGAAGTLVILR